jgi:hypothetical protein
MLRFPTPHRAHLITWWEGGRGVPGGPAAGQTVAVFLTAFWCGYASA